MSVIDLCQQIVRNNLADCCTELVEWWETGVLCGGVIRDVAAKLRELDKENNLRMAERLVEKEAVYKCSISKSAL